MDIRKAPALLLLLLFVPAFLAAQSKEKADSLFQLGKKYDEKGMNPEAEQYYGEAYHLYRSLEDTAGWFEAGKEYASALVRSSKTDRAFQLYNMLYNLSHPVNDVYNRGDIQNSIGWASLQIGAYDKALEHLNKALPLALESNDAELIGVVYNNIGSAYSSKGKLDLSLEYRKKVRPFYEKLGNPRRNAILLNNIGGIYRDLGLYDRALEFYSQSLEIRKTLGNVSLLATIYHNIAEVHNMLGNYDQALIFLQECLEYRKKAGEPSATAATLNNIGLAYKNLGQREKALTYYKESLRIKKSFASPDENAVTYRNIGILLEEGGDNKAAFEYYKKALSLFQDVGNPINIARILITLSRIEREVNNWDKSILYAERAKLIADSTQNLPMLVGANDNLGDIKFQREEYREALDYYKKRHSYSTSVSPSEQIWALKDLSNTYDRLESDSALTCALKAINLIEEQRANTGAAAVLRAGYFSQHAGFYKETAHRLIKYRDDVAGAYHLVESAKARVMADELQEAALRIDEKLPEEVRIERNTMVNKINRLYSELESSVNEASRDSLRDTIRRAEFEYAAYQNRLRNKYPQFKVLTSPEPVSLSEAQSLLEKGTAVLEYSLTENHLLTFLVGMDGVRVKKISLENRSDSLKQYIQHFRDAILAHAPAGELNSYSLPLAKLLVLPFEQELDRYSNLVVVPDGALAHLPFEALSWNGRYLIESFDIKYAPSITSLKLITPYEETGAKPLLAVAGSAFTGNFSLSTLRSAKLNTLPSTLMEVDSIASHFTGSVTLKDQQVREGSIKQYLSSGKRYRYIHLATHGVIDESNPDLSGLVLTSEDRGDAISSEDGLLRSSEIYRLILNSDMVVLSACNSGLGKVVQGEGMLGLQRSFFYAGTSTVVVSLWNVYDRSTAIMMNEFYKAILNTRNDSSSWWNTLLRWTGWDTSLPFGEKAKAMRRAKLKMIEHPVYNHPVYWAPFIVVGR